MKQMTGQFLESCRLTTGPMASSREYGFNGLFFIPAHVGSNVIFKVICSDGGGWEHVSVSLKDRCPTWDEMCFIKSLFWAPYEAVMQLHPPESEYVNNLGTCLHLWKPVAALIPLPPKWMVGVKDLGVLQS